MDTTTGKLPGIARAGAILAFIFAALAAASAFTTGQLLVLLAVPIYAVAAMGMLRGRAWSAYGICLLEAAGAAAVLIARLRDGWEGISGQTATALALGVTAVLFYFFVGRSLAASGAPAGHPAPWIVLACVLSLPLLFVQSFSVPTGSMENTLLIGDLVLVDRWPHPVPKRGDMVVYHYQADRTQAFIKRVVGVPGDRIRIADKRIYLNGQPVEEPYVIHSTSYIDSFRDNFPGEPNLRLGPEALDMLEHHVTNSEVVVPEMSYFVLGDNRDNSFDSRFTGFVKAADLMGKPVLIFWSRAAARGPIRWSRAFKLLS